MKQNVYLPEGRLLFTPKNLETTSSRESLEKAYLNGTILEGLCSLCDTDQNLHVRVGGFEGIIPRSEAVSTANGERSKDIAVISRVGKPVCFKIIDIKGTENRPLYILSRRAAQRECRLNFIRQLSAGDIIDARVTHLESFGAFVDVGCGLISLLSIDTISVSRIAHPKDRLSCGQDIKVVVRTPADENDRITLTHKELLGTWKENAELFSAGQTAAGIIRSIESYGVFVELAPNLAGLAEYKEGSEVGKQAAVYLKSIIPEKMKLKLVIIDVYPFDAAPTPSKYFVKGDHIDYWRYSPTGCEKLIESYFGGEEDYRLMHG